MARRFTAVVGTPCAQGGTEHLVYLESDRWEAWAAGFTLANVIAGVTKDSWARFKVDGKPVSADYAENYLKTRETC